MLKLALIENLRRLAEELLAGARRAPRRRRLRRRGRTRRRRRRAAARHRRRRSSSSCSTASANTGCACRRFASPWTTTSRSRHTTAEETIRGEHQRQGVAQVSVANAVTSLRLCATLDWQEYVEAVSLVEQVLQRDPAGAYGRMDFLSRDQQRQAVEELAPAERRRPGARRAEGDRKRARRRRPAARPADRAAHVGYHLVDRGRARSRSRPRLSARRCAMRVRRAAAAPRLGALPRRDRDRHRRC